MLTATYTLVALSVEQASVRVSLQSLQKLLDSSFVQQAALTPGQVSYACDAVQRLYHNCHWRKIDIFLIPAIGRATAQADSLLAQLDALSNTAGEAIADITKRASAGPIDSEPAVRRFVGLVEAFCDAMLMRLDREEHELFALARTVISGETWFDIANQMLAHDAYRQETRPLREPMMADAAAVTPPAGFQPDRRQAAGVPG